MRKNLLLVAILIGGFVSCGCISSQQPIIADNATSTIPTTASIIATIATVSALPTQSIAISNIPPEQASFDKGMELYNQKKYREAIDAFNTTIAMNTTNGQAYFARGMAFYQIGKIKRYEFRGDEEFDQAINDFTTALHEGLNSNDTTDLLISRGYSNYYLGDNYRNRYTKIGEKSFHFYEAAVKDFSKVLENNPDNVDALIGRSMSNLIIGKGCQEPEYQHDQSKNDLARIDGERAINLAPNNGYARFAHYNSQEESAPELAIMALNEAIKDEPGEAVFYVQRGVRKLMLQDYEAARADYEKAIELQPRFAMAYQGLGYTERKQGNKEAALVNMQKALEINPNMALWWCEFGFTQKSLMDPFTVQGLEEVLKSYDRGIAIDPEEPYLHLYRWDVLMCLNRIPEAKEEVRIYKNLVYGDPDTAKFMEKVTDDPYYNPKVMARYS